MLFGEHHLEIQSQSNLPQTLEMSHFSSSLAEQTLHLKKNVNFLLPTKILTVKMNLTLRWRLQYNILVIQPAKRFRYKLILLNPSQGWKSRILEGAPVESRWQLHRHTWKSSALKTHVFKKKKFCEIPDLILLRTDIKEIASNWSLLVYGVHQQLQYTSRVKIL